MFSLDQYHAATRGAVVFDRSPQGRVELRGADRLSFLHALLTNDVAKLVAGTGTYAAYLTPQGRMISDMRVEELGDAVVLDVEGEVAGALATRLDSLVFSEDVQTRDVSREYAELSVHGPAAAGAIEQVLGIPTQRLRSLQPYDNLRAPGSAVIVVREDRFGVEGFDVYVPAERGDATTRAIVAAGAVRGDDEVAEVLRIESGRARFGLDMDTDTIPLEAGIEGRAISLTKGCYVGQEVIIRVLHRGHGRVARRLVGLVVAGEVVPSRGDTILAGDVEVGRVTSAAASPRFGSPLALGYVQRDHTTVGTTLAIQHGERRLQARVHQFDQ